MIRCSIKSKEFKQRLNERIEDRKNSLRLQKEIEYQNKKVKENEERYKEIVEASKFDWRSELFPQEEQFEPVEIVEEIKVKVPEKLKSNWREEFYSVEPEVDEPKEEVIEVPEHLKNNWRKELIEGMTTGGGEIQFAPTDVPLDTIDAGDVNSYVSGSNIDSVVPLDGLEGCAIVSNGTGSGSNGGFNLGKNHLSFNGIGYDFPDLPGVQNSRGAYFGPFDTSRATTIEIMAIVGNGSNGGEAPSQPLYFGYGTIGDPSWDLTDDDGNIQIAVPANGAGTLTKYTLTLPMKARIPGMIFVLNHQEGTNLPNRTIDNYGITEIKVKRTTPISVFAPLDTPEAVSFFRVGPSVTGGNYETPEQRYRRVMQQLLASKSYTSKLFGSNYPGSNFSGLRGVSASPIGKEASYDAWNQAAQQPTPQSSKDPELMKKFQDGKPLSQIEVEKLFPDPTERKDALNFYDVKRGIDMYNSMLDKLKSSPIKGAGGQADYNYYTRPSMIKAYIEDPKAKLQKLEQEFTQKYGYSPNNIAGKSSTPPTPPTPPKPQLDKYGRQIGTPLPPGVQQDIEKGGKTSSPIGDAAIMAAAAALLRGGFKGGASGAETGSQLPARGSAEWQRMAKEYTRANPGQYNPFMTNAQNNLARIQNLGKDAMPLKSLKNSYQSQGEVITEKKTPTKLKTVQQALYPGQPSPNGFPDEPPPQQLPNGFHQDYGQRDSMFNRMDKATALATPPTGNPIIDKKVNQAKKQPK